jgi:TIR domain
MSDFAPGANFVEKMHEASERSQVVLAVLSERYLESAFAGDEWTSSVRGRKLLFVRVAGKRPDGILGSVVWIDLVDLDEDTARKRLLEGAERFLAVQRGQGGRAKPNTAPPFPRPAVERPVSVPAPFPRGAPPPKTLRQQLVEAAQHGVLPAAVPPVGAAMAPRPSASSRPWFGNGGPRTPGGSAGGGLLGIVIAAVLVGAVTGALAAAGKWLLGWFVQSGGEINPEGTILGCTVFAPSIAAPGASIFVQAFVHLPEEADDARAMATEFDVDTARGLFRVFGRPSSPAASSASSCECRGSRSTIP